MNSAQATTARANQSSDLWQMELFVHSPVLALKLF
jgi:hypothetical protein